MKLLASKYWFLAVIFVVGIVNTVTMPYYFYAGDSAVQKSNAIELVNKHHFGLSEDINQNQVFTTALTLNGQYYVYNPKTKRYVSRWGIFNSLVMAVPELFLPTKGHPIQFSRASITAHNIFNIVLSIIFAVYIFALSTSFAQKAFSHSTKCKISLIAFSFTIFTCYASFVWNYLRAQSYDVWHLLCFTMFITHYFKGKAEDQLKSSAFPYPLKNVHLYLAALVLGMMVLSKEIYGLIFLVILLDLFWQKASGKAYLFWVCYGALLLGLIGLMNYEAFNQVFLGRGRLHHDPSSTEAIFALKYLWPRFKDYFLSPNWSIWVNFPLILLALCGMKEAFKYFKRLLRFLLITAAMFSVIFLIYYTKGEWCYGPRFYLFILPVLSLPAIFTMAQISLLKRPLKILCGLIIVTVLTLNLGGQHYINKREFFMSYTYASLFETWKLPLAYFDERPRVLLMKDIDELIKYQKPNAFYDLAVQQTTTNEEKIQRIVRIRAIDEAYRSNYYFW